MDYARGRNVVPDSWPGFVPLAKLLLEEQPSSLLLNCLIQAVLGRVLCKPHRQSHHLHRSRKQWRREQGFSRFSKFHTDIGHHSCPFPVEDRKVIWVSRSHFFLSTSSFRWKEDSKSRWGAGGSKHLSEMHGCSVDVPTRSYVKISNCWVPGAQSKNTHIVLFGDKLYWCPLSLWQPGQRSEIPLSVTVALIPELRTK